MENEGEEALTEGAEGREGAKAPETDWKAEARKWEERAKANYDKAKAYDEAEEATARLEAELGDLKRKAELDAARARVAKKTGVPESLVTGDDEESMTEFAKAVAAFAKPDPAPRMPGAGKFAGDGAAELDARLALARQMFGRNDS